MKRGLTLGKYAPLHKGHQLVIETALAEMDEVYVIIYDSPEVTDIPLPVRSEWIRKLYPETRVIEAWDGPCEVGDSTEIKANHENYIINKLKLPEMNAFYSSEFYGKHMSKALKAVNRIVDPGRKNNNISGSQIRINPYKYRKFISPSVYRDLISNVVFLGAPCTGKTSIVKRLAQEFQTQWMPEYGREYWEKNQENRQLSLDQLVEIAEIHRIKEDKKLENSDKYLFTDTNAITTYMFSRYYHNNADLRLEELALKASARYDIVFLCDIDIPYENTWDRSGEIKRKIFQKQIIADLKIRKIPCFLLKGNMEKRVEQVKYILKKFKKYNNIRDKNGE
ncbi:AAA family ATPase [Desulfobacterales bacterium HSG17]|nr:AAA family ATPase [Desulfobacterales bacterium HSG17]